MSGQDDNDPSTGTTRRDDAAGPRAPVSEQVHLEVDLLKAGVGDAKTSQPTESAAPRGSGRAPTLLVVDDDQDMRAYVRRCLKVLHSEIGLILEADDGAEALARARQGDVDVIICDVVMPGLDGFGLCRALRQDEALQHIPVLLITGEFSARELQDKAARTGASGVLTKPFNARKLCAQVTRILRRTSPPRTRLGAG